jgi:hypothetical protein
MVTLMVDQEKDTQHFSYLWGQEGSQIDKSGPELGPTKELQRFMPSRHM